jgi:predicted Mrr-cat superfamily restriction endonuclease
VTAPIAVYGEKAGRMLRHFADLPNGTLVWTRTSDGMYHLGRATGPYRYDASPAADSVGIHHTRPARWLQRAFAEHEIPAAVADAFARGGRNLQRTRDHQAESRTAELWAAES